MQKKYCKLNNNDFSDMNYIVYYPEKELNNLPLLLFLHGIGERGKNIVEIGRASCRERV